MARLDPFPDQEYTTANKETITIHLNGAGRYEVVCWDMDDNCRWFLYFDKQSEAVTEFERWRN